MEAIFNSPQRSGSSHLQNPLSPPPRPQAMESPQDRFISNRISQDNSFSNFLLLSADNTSPIPSSKRHLGYSSPPIKQRPSSSVARADGSLSPMEKGDFLVRGSSHGRSADAPNVFTRLQLETSPQTIPLEPYSNKVVRSLFSDTPPQTTVLSLHSQSGQKNKNETENEEERYRKSLGVVFEENRARNFQSRSFRVIAQTPERILDAADIVDDFYLNLIDWSSTDILAVALRSTVYLWESATSAISQLPSSPRSSAMGSNNIVCGVNWNESGQHLALGQSDGSIEIWDYVQKELVRAPLFHHSSRVGSLAWSGNLLASGSKDSTIRLIDFRDPRNNSSILRAHTQEVCGLKFSPNGVHLASGGNDNQLLIWDKRNVSSPMLYLNEHTSAVKAFSWNPIQQDLLVSGGGTEDKMLRFWNITSGGCINSINTQSQVCGVLWSKMGNELVSSHGFSNNQLTLWKYPTLRRIVDLTGHTSRVLHLCMSSDGQLVISAAGDETIRFWRCFPPQDYQGSPNSSGRPTRLSGPSGNGLMSYGNSLTNLNHTSLLGSRKKVGGGWPDERRNLCPNGLGNELVDPMLDEEPFLR